MKSENESKLALWFVAVELCVIAGLIWIYPQILYTALGIGR